MQQTGKGLVTLDVYSVPDEAECLEDQVQFMIFAGSAGNSLSENVGSPPRPQLPGMVGDDGEMTFSIETGMHDQGQLVHDALPASARPQLRTALWMDGGNFGVTSSMSGDGAKADFPFAVPPDAAGNDLPDRLSADAPDPAVSPDWSRLVETGLPQGPRVETSLPLGFSALPQGRPMDPFPTALRVGASGISELALGPVRPDALPAAPLVVSAPSPTVSGTGPTVEPPKIALILPQGAPGTAGENPATLAKGVPGQPSPLSNGITGEVTPRGLQDDAFVARPAPSLQATVKSPQATVLPETVDPARDFAGGSTAHPTTQPRLQEGSSSPTTGNPTAQVPALGPETVPFGTRMPADRTERDSSGPFAGRPGQSTTVPPMISTGLESREAPLHGHSAQGAGDDMSGQPGHPAATKIAEALSIRERQVSRESQMPATVTGPPKTMMPGPDLSQVSRMLADGSGPLTSGGTMGGTPSGIHGPGDLSGETVTGLFPDTMETGQSGHSSPGDSLRRVPESEIRMTTLARGATAQIAEAVRLPLDGSIEVRLSPEELGRVRVSMIPGEAGLVIQLVAERPETLELLRRHADLLAADLQNAGYTGLEFSFSREDRGHDPSGAGSGPRPDPTVEQIAMQPTAPGGIARSDADGALDLRL